jgi:hypothetical protein
LQFKNTHFRASFEQKLHPLFVTENNRLFTRVSGRAREDFCEDPLQYPEEAILKVGPWSKERVD